MLSALRKQIDSINRGELDESIIASLPKQERAEVQQLLSSHEERESGKPSAKARGKRREDAGEPDEAEGTSARAVRASETPSTRIRTRRASKDDTAAAEDSKQAEDADNAASPSVEVESSVAPEDEEDAGASQPATRSTRNTRKGRASTATTARKRKAAEVADSPAGETPPSKKAKGVEAVDARFVKQAKNFMTQLRGHPVSNVFAKLPTKKDAENYLDIVHFPMSLDEADKRVKNGEIKSLAELMRELLRMLANACQFNVGPDDVAALEARRMLPDLEECVFCKSQGTVKLTRCSLGGCLSP